MHKIILPKILQPFKCLDLIRLGKKNDGGYLISYQDVLNTKNFIGFGVGEDCSFELDFLKLNDVAISLYDKDSRASNNLYQNQFHSNRKFHTKNIGNGFDEISVESVLKDTDSVFLKCDIEGNEYNILDDIMMHDRIFSGLVIEFHDIAQYKNFNLVTNFIGKTRLKLVHLHINNYMYYKTENGVVPDVIELTFTSSENIIYDKNLTLPNVLDMPNNPNDLEFHIDF